MRKLLKVLVVLSVSAPAFVLAQTQCFGGENFKTCTDYSTGNSYQINKWGNTTQVYGRNPRTGSNWSETSQTFGNQTFRRGTAADGSTWNQTIMTTPGMTQMYGTDSKGNSFSKTCTQFGCF